MESGKIFFVGECRRIFVIYRHKNQKLRTPLQVESSDYDVQNTCSGASEQPDDLRH